MSYPKVCTQFIEWFSSEAWSNEAKKKTITKLDQAENNSMDTNQSLNSKSKTLSLESDDYTTVEQIFQSKMVASASFSKSKSHQHRC